jgi:hypothetical protein
MNSIYSKLQRMVFQLMLTKLSSATSNIINHEISQFYMT